ncbi:MAG TPA: NAD(P)H-hydrate dehydratase, partial [Sulfurimonas sp.]|nr:NAD(P)H-hydrate dehydratase [Sulfurimonas sp.]
HSIAYELFHRDIIITPHPKEFVHILRTTQLADISVEQLQDDRFYYTELFCETYPNITLILKGSNSIIAKSKTYFINPHGSSRLAKAGSGDVLSGICGALLAQGYSSLDAAVQASLAQTMSAQSINKNSYSLLAEDIIKGLSNL